MSAFKGRISRVAKAVLQRKREERRRLFREELARRGVLEQFDKSTDVKEMLKLVYPSNPFPTPIHLLKRWKP